MTDRLQRSAIAAGAIAVALLLSACTVTVNVFHHHVGVAAPPARGDATTRVSGARHAVLYVETVPALSRVRLLSDGTATVRDDDLGTAPITIRMGPASGEPLSRAACGRTLVFLVEREGYRAERAFKRLSCYPSARLAEQNHNVVRVALQRLPQP